MTYEKARDYEIFMPPMEGMHTAIICSSPDNYYVTYKPNNPMMGMGMEMRMKSIELVDRIVDDEEYIHTPPAGRDQKAHNNILRMNKRKR